MRKIFILTFLISIFVNNAHAKFPNKNNFQYNKNAIQNQIDQDLEFESYQSTTTIKIHDPYEKINRQIFAINDAFDRYFF
jgi:ABC-type transporter lipoprotein component MlaA